MRAVILVAAVLAASFTAMAAVVRDTHHHTHKLHRGDHPIHQQHHRKHTIDNGVSSARKGLMSSPVVVQTPYGAVSGVADQGVTAFRGIPYAKPPVGARRLAKTEPLPMPGWSGVLDGSQFAPGCPAHCPNSSFPKPWLMCPERTSEDCLFLNIFTPAPANGTATGTAVLAAANLPVIMFIHGGNYNSGSGGVILYDGGDLARNENVVVVTINYRLAALGGLYTGTVKGNFQTMDQREAMRFVQNIIGSFGGNPQKVTISGQSAGAFSVATHLSSPKSWPYFQGAIIVSDPAALLAAPPQIAMQLGQEVLKSVGCPQGGDLELECLRALPVEAFVQAQGDTYHEPNELLMIMMEWVPVVDGDELPYQPLFALTNKLFNPVPVFFGTTANESVQFIFGLAPTPMTPLEFYGLFDIIFGIGGGTAAEKEYGPVPAQFDKDARFFVTEPTTDYIFYCVNRFIGAGLTQSTPTYMWLFDKVASWSEWAFNATMPYCAQNVCHAADLPFIFNPFNAPLPPGRTVPQPTPEEEQLITTMQRAWGNFARTGSPNPLPFALPNIPLFDAQVNMVVNFSTPVSLLTGYRNHYCDFWDTMGYFRY